MAGLLAALVALAVGELVAGLLGQESGLVVAVGGGVIDLVPPSVEDFAISVFGTADKPALVVGIVVLALLFGAFLGWVSVRRFWLGAAGFLAFAFLGVVAVFNDPQLSTAFAWIGPGAAAGAGVATLAALLRPRRVRVGEAEAGPPSVDRRAFLVGAGFALGAAALSVAAGRFLVDRARRVVARSRSEVVLPGSVEPVASPPPAAALDVPGISPVVTPNGEFYRIDTALTVPMVELETWRLRVTGMVDRPYELDFGDLLDMDMVERYVTLACVSNEVGGDLISNALWLGVPLERILERADVSPEATQIVGRSVDDFTVGFPTRVALDGRVALVAVGMNGEPLPFEHGFPARLVVAGLYGYVSATKWLSEIELTTLEAFDAYWVPRGWAKEAPIKTQSRIDVPRKRARLDAGLNPIAGVAWAPNRGIAGVEVSVDDGPWQVAQISEPLSDDSWVQWSYGWDARPGDHVVRVRAIDGSGEVQIAAEQPPRPDGATGYHTIEVRVA